MSEVFKREDMVDGMVIKGYGICMGRPIIRQDLMVEHLVGRFVL